MAKKRKYIDDDVNLAKVEWTHEDYMSVLHESCRPIQEAIRVTSISSEVRDFKQFLRDGHGAYGDWNDRAFLWIQQVNSAVIGDSEVNPHLREAIVNQDNNWRDRCPVCNERMEDGGPLNKLLI